MDADIDISNWYSQKENLYCSLLTYVQQLLETLLSDKEIHHLPIETRVKTLDSLMQKLIRKEYTSPEQITDLGGMRIIGFIQSDASKINEVVEKNFEVDHPGKEDKVKKTRTRQSGILINTL